MKAGLPLAHHHDLSASFFQEQWQIYRKFVDNNYFYHREVYGQLHRILVDEAVQPFRFLDIACGDARATVDALKGTRVAHYHGIDLSQAALDLASKTLEALACPVTLDHRDFIEALRDRPEPVDVAWIGLSLHHLLTPDKLTFMREIRGVVGDRGLFLIYENASPDAEDRDAWLLRWERQNQPLWPALTPEEYEAMRAHVRANDFPETTSRWHSLGHEAGFDRVRELSYHRRTSSGCTVLRRKDGSNETGFLKRTFAATALLARRQII